MARKKAPVKSKLQQWQREDAARLRALFKDKRRNPLTQEEFGAQFGLGTQGMIWQYLSGRRPLNFKALAKFANGLKVAHEEISPTLDSQLKAYSSGISPAGMQQDPDGALRYALHLRFPALSPDDVAAIIGYAEGKSEKTAPLRTKKRGSAGHGQ